MASLDSLLTSDNLVPCSALVWDSEHLLIKGSSQHVYVEPRAIGVIKHLKTRQDLWNCAKIRVGESKRDFRGAPVFGVPFEKALELLSRESYNKPILKSMYCRDDASYISDNRLGFLGSLVAHVSRKMEDNDVRITLEAWETISAGPETFYIHGIFSSVQKVWIHLDGATMNHSDYQKGLLFNKGNKTKGTNYAKHFRLDGRLSTCEVVKIANAFLPLDEVTPQYMQQLPSVSAALT